MITDVFLALLGGLIASGAATYLAWTRLRPWVLRQELFAIRDRLWMEALDADLLDHPAHRELREDINRLIRISPYVTLPIALRWLADRDPAAPPVFPTPPAYLSRDVPDWIVRAQAEILFAVYWHLFFRGLSGWICGGCFVLLVGFRKVGKLAREQVAEILSKGFARDLDEAMSDAGLAASTA